MPSRALNGLAAVAVAVGVTQLLAAAFGRGADALNAVGSAVIDRTPGPVKEWAIQTFGTADKLFLSVTMLVVIAVLAAAAGAVGDDASAGRQCADRGGGRRRVRGDPVAARRRPLDVIPTVVGILAGIVLLRIFTRKAAQRQHDSEPDAARRLSLTALAVLSAACWPVSLGGIVSRRLQSVAGERNAAVLPPAAKTAPPLPAGVQPKDVALPSFVTRNTDFYRIDTALLVPQVSRTDWRLRIHGMVDREITYSFDDLNEFEVVEKAVTLTCVSNPVGGDLIGNAVWRGYRVRDLLDPRGDSPRRRHGAVDVDGRVHRRNAGRGADRRARVAVWRSR